MIDIALTVCVLLQDPTDKVKDAFPKLREAWKAVGEWRNRPEHGEGLTDDFIRAMGALSAAFEAAGCFDAEPTVEAHAVKRLLLRRAGEPAPLNRGFVVTSGGIARFAPPGEPLGRLEKALARLGELKSKRLDDKGNLQEAHVELGKALEEMGLTHDEVPQWMRRRILRVAQALVTGEAYPAWARATPEQEKRTRDLVELLGDTDMEERERASHELGMMGEPAVPLLRGALKHSDAEVRERAKKLLGIGLKGPPDATRGVPFAEDRQGLLDLGGVIWDFREALEVKPIEIPKIPRIPRVWIPKEDD